MANKLEVHKHGRLMVEFTRKGGAVTMRVLAQGRGLRNGGVIARFVSSNGFVYEISSFSNPELRFDELYLRGRRGDRDKDPATYVYSIPRQARTAIARWKRMIAAVNEVEP